MIAFASAITQQSRRHLATPDRDADRWVGLLECIAKGSEVIHLSTSNLSMFIDTEIRNIERAIVGNFDKCETVIPSIDPCILWSHVAKATR
jgi:hypothetical protein